MLVFKHGTNVSYLSPYVRWSFHLWSLAWPEIYMDHKLREEKTAHCTIYITCYERSGFLFSFFFIFDSQKFLILTVLQKLLKICILSKHIIYSHRMQKCWNKHLLTLDSRLGDLPMFCNSLTDVIRLVLLRIGAWWVFSFWLTRNLGNKSKSRNIFVIFPNQVKFIYFQFFHHHH